ncbi:hypothetical protein EDC46_0418 [Vespertiliibacter pulmonis]|uniref:Uncharacterized protein n=1 Tax=Vespertiliibacter pulmonis TaxID=1443036 RepID=A0A3N4W910_9PAST|nr:hypothetical protein [Vespertiliibacter pulmonis]RPE86027.1 hypothetical protein EDC46_0418 [Vespertiliibacter pulmonis]
MIKKIHVIPLNDYRDHIESEQCWCKPIEIDGVVVHNAMDQREAYETGKLKYH